MVVVDSSALAKYILREEGWEKVRGFLEKDKVYSLFNAVIEVSNTVWRKAVVYRGEPEDISMKRLQLLQKLVESRVIEFENEIKYLGKAIDIAFRYGIPVAEALFIAQALELKETLVTCSKRQADTATKLGIDVVLID